MAAIDSLRQRLASSLPSFQWFKPHLPTEWADLDAALPDHGLPRGVVELTAPHGLGGGTSIALAAVRAVHRRDPRTWCAWVDSEGTLYGPGVARAGVDLDRLLVVRPPRSEAGRIAVKIVGARACELIVVDATPLLSTTRPIRDRAGVRRPCERGKSKKELPPEVLVRKLSLLAEQAGATVILLTDSLAPRGVPLPVALRLELGRALGHLIVKVAKDRYGRAGGEGSIVPMKTRPLASLSEEAERRAAAEKPKVG